MGKNGGMSPALQGRPKCSPWPGNEDSPGGHRFHQVYSHILSMTTHEYIQSIIGYWADGRLSPQ